MKIKKLTAISLTAMMILLAACGSSKADQGAQQPAAETAAQETVEEPSEQEQAPESDEANQEAEAETQEAAEAAAASEAAENAETPDKTETAESGAKTLVIYFSADNTKDADIVSSATPMVDGVSSVKWIAEIIHDSVGGDIAEIIPSTDYPQGYNELADAAKEEADSEARPAIEALSVDLTSYDTVFIGYPMWWYRMPMVMETFFDTYDFNSVTIIPFNTHAGSRDGGTYDMIRDREPGATVLEGFNIDGEDAGKEDAREAVTEWLSGLDLE